MTWDLGQVMYEVCIGQVRSWQLRKNYQSKLHLVGVQEPAGEAAKELSKQVTFSGSARASRRIYTFLQKGE
jgi:hypothetical protein